MSKKIILFSSLFFILLIPAVFVLLLRMESSGDGELSLPDFSLLFCLVTILFSLLLVFFIMTLIRGQRLDGNVWIGGKTAWARIDQIKTIRLLPGGAIADVNLLLEIQPYDRPSFQGRVEVPVPVSLLPRLGQMILVKYGPVFKRRIILEKPLDEQLNPGDEAALKSSTYFYPPTDTSNADRLHRLGDLRSLGALSAKEYQAARARVSGNLVETNGN